MSQKKCPSCNAQVAEQSKFCPECGSPISPSTTQKTKPAKGNPMRDTLIIVSVIVIAAVGYFMINKPVSLPASQEEHVNQEVDPNHQDIEGMTSALGNLPNDYNSLVQLGNQTMDQKNFPMAAECYKRALKIKSDSSDIRTDYGACLYGMGLPERAIEEFMKVIKKYPKHRNANFNLGIVYYTLSQVDSAKTYFNKYLSLETTGPTADAAKNYLKELNK